MSASAGQGSEHAAAQVTRAASVHGSWRLALKDRSACNDNAKARAKLVVMLVVSVAMLGVSMLSAACSSGDGADSDSGAAHPVTPTTRLLEEVPAPDPVTPDGVAVAALKEIYTWQPVTESPGASLTRARKWLGPSMIRMLDTSPSGLETPKPSLQWADWAKANAHVEAFTFASGDRPPAGADPNIQQFKIGVEQTVVYPNGRKEPLPPATVIATVVNTSDGWRLDAFR
ncbi:hypothetical protein [Nocardia australiensis]|uniref:hypothetical protein n=1 Tax=Nocardia australiensis TaxID=2887191 RepID=UPI001D15A184|nr:hypothetical protein [Nocardia australiensis]